MNQVFLALGTNLGDRLENLEDALKMIGINVGDILKVSSVYETSAWGIENQPDFLNMVLEINTALDLLEVLDKINIIEKDLGRVRYEKWGSRKIDIDILFYNDSIISSEELEIPHRYMHERKFVLEPLNEIASTYIHPLLKESIDKLLSQCKDSLEVKLYQKENIK